MTNERYVRKGYKIWDNVNNEEFYELHYRYECDDICDILNEYEDKIEKLTKEKDYWKGGSCSLSNMNWILLHELDIAQEQGYKVSDPFKELMKKEITYEPKEDAILDLEKGVPL